MPLAITPDDLEPALRALRAARLRGMQPDHSRTSERALEIVDEVDALARRIGAISCVVVRPDGSLAGTNNDVLRLRAQHPAAAAGLARRRGARGRHRRRRRRARRRAQPARSRRARDPRGQSDACAGGEHSRATSARLVVPIDVGRSSSRARRRGDAGQHDEPGMVGQPPLDLDLATLPPRARLVADIVYIPLETPLLAAARAAAATAPSTASGCCCTRRASPGSSGSDSEPKVTPELRSAVEATLPHHRT